MANSFNMSARVVNEYHPPKLAGHYLAVVLSEASRAKLKLKFGKLHPNAYAHHVTLAFNPTQDDVDFWGGETQNVDLLATHVGSNDRAHAVRVVATSPTNGVEIAYQEPSLAGKRLHVTLSVAVGAKPVESNMIEIFEELEEPVKLSGCVTLVRK